MMESGGLNKPSKRIQKSKIDNWMENLTSNLIFEAWNCANYVRYTFSIVSLSKKDQASSIIGANSIDSDIEKFLMFLLPAKCYGG